jgi:16S rRNA processing protein RimM
MDSLLEVGQVVNSYGIKGFLKIVPLVDTIEQFKSFKILYMQNKEELEVEEVKFSKNLVLVKVKGIDTIEDALKFKNLYLYAKREDIKLEEGAHFIVDLIGLEVYTEDGKLLGLLKEVLQPGANDVYVVENEDKKQILLPVIPDVVKNIDIPNKKIIVHLINGLI